MQPGESAAPVPSGRFCAAGEQACAASTGSSCGLTAGSTRPRRSVAPGDAGRAADVGDVLGSFDKVLDMRHEGEDLLMYPQLAERAPACALHVALMLQQRERGHRSAGSGSSQVRLASMRSAAASAAADLAERYEDLSTVLKVHLRREVTEVMPAVDRVLTQDEVKVLAQRGIDRFDRKFLVSYLGMVLATNPPDRGRNSSRRSPHPSDRIPHRGAPESTGDGTRPSFPAARTPRRSSRLALDPAHLAGDAPADAAEWSLPESAKSCSFARLWATSLCQAVYKSLASYLRDEEEG